MNEKKEKTSKKNIFVVLDDDQIDVSLPEETKKKIREIQKRNEEAFEEARKKENENETKIATTTIKPPHPTEDLTIIEETESADLKEDGEVSEEENEYAKHRAERKRTHPRTPRKEISGQTERESKNAKQNGIPN